MTTASPNVYTAINAVQDELAKIGIAKDGVNEQQKYKFRGIDQVYSALSPLLAKHGLCVLPRVLSYDRTERTTMKPGYQGGPAKESTTFYVTVEAEFDFVAVADGSKHTIRTIGEAMDNGDKATNKAMSAAYKYAAFMAFAIPTEGDNDADSTTHEVVNVGSDLINEKQVMELETIAADVGANVAAFCQYFKIAKLEDIPASSFESARKALQAKKRKAA